mmetsp:Transcript_26161/g.62177  ORF Transcript_26161/g.62177 Transcript_26161/m.62177 type:complete len:163 (+) Transcript_26161:2-490(+)
MCGGSRESCRVMTQNMAAYQIPSGFSMDEMGGGAMWMMQAPKVHFQDKRLKRKHDEVGDDENMMEQEGGDVIAKKMKMHLREAFLQHGAGYADQCFDEAARNGLFQNITPDVIFEDYNKPPAGFASHLSQMHAGVMELEAADQETAFWQWWQDKWERPQRGC